MIDSLRASEPLADESAILSALEVKPFAYILVTLHPPSNVDNLKVFSDPRIAGAAVVQAGARR